MQAVSLPGGVEVLAVGAGVLFAGWCAVRGLRRFRRRGRRATPAVRVAAVAAVACTAYSADTSWRFAAHYLDMGSTAERAAMFGAAELALFATALLARQNLNGPQGAPGVAGALVWVITGVQIIPAYAESGVVGGTVRAFVGPVMAALLWHQAMGIELRHHKPGTVPRGLAAVVGREVRERVLSRLGIAERDRDAAQITRDRATVRAVALAARLAEMSQEQRSSRTGRRIARRLSVQVARASVGTDAGQRRKLLDQLAARRHAVSLATVDLASPWDVITPDPAASALAAQARDQMRQATTNVRQGGYPKVLFADIAPAQAVNTRDEPDCSPEQGDEADATSPAAPKLSTEAAQAVIEDGWAKGLTVRETAKQATRAPSYVHSVFVRLDEQRGPRPTSGQLALVNGRGRPVDETSDAAQS